MSPLRRTDTDGIDRHTLRGGMLRGTERIVLVVLPVGNEDDDTTRSALRSERRGCERNGAPQCGALPGNHIGRYLRHKSAGRQIIGGYGKLHVGVARKDDHAYLILFQSLQHLLHGIFGPFEPVGLKIVGQHGVGNIDRQHDLHPLALHLPQFGAELRPGKRQGQQHQRRKEKHHLVAHAGRRGLGHEPRERQGIAETRKSPATRPESEQIHRRKQRHRRQQV